LSDETYKTKFNHILFRSIEILKTKESVLNCVKKSKVRPFFENLIQTSKNTGYIENEINYERALFLSLAPY